MFYISGLPFHFARNLNYCNSYAYVATYNILCYVPTGYNALRTTLLQKERANVERLFKKIKDWRESWFCPHFSTSNWWRKLSCLGSIVRKSLIAKNKLGFIDGSLTLSSPIVDSPSAIQAWIHADNIVRTWIINSVSPMIQASVIYRDTTLEIWKDLKETFCHKNGSKIFNLYKQISELHQGETSITDFFTQLKVF